MRAISTETLQMDSVTRANTPAISRVWTSIACNVEFLEAQLLVIQDPHSLFDVTCFIHNSNAIWLKSYYPCLHLAKAFSVTSPRNIIYLQLILISTLFFDSV